MTWHDMSNKIICDCCGKEPATIKDTRERKDNMEQFRVCVKCANRTDASFWGTIAARRRREQKTIKSKL
jgi:protein-arginine kinase activator protein McsA